jgi:hypothetical protein
MSKRTLETTMSNLVKTRTTGTEAHVGHIHKPYII